MNSEILVVEDDDLAPLAIMRTLRQRNHPISLARDAVMALTMAVRNRPGLILLDMGLPAGGGDAVIQQIRKHPDLCATPIVVLSGDRMLEHDAVVASGADAFFRKGDDPLDLIATIEKLLGSQAHAQPLVS